MHNFFEGPICMGNEREDHPTQKPLYLIQNLLRIHSNEGNLVLDPFAGTGTLGLACEKMNRKWICIEKERKYFNIAKRRIDDYCKQIKLF